MGGRTIALGVAVILLAGLGAGIAAYELGLRAGRNGVLTSSNGPASPTPAPASPSARPGLSPSPSAAPSLPSPRSNAAWAYDASTGQFVLFGGNRTTGSYNEFPQPLGDTWVWTGAAWTPAGSSSPSARFSASVTYDEAHRTVVLFGGATGTNVDADTWTWVGTRWLQMGPSQSPPPSNLFESPIAFDPATGVAVLVTGTSVAIGPTPVRTWTWNGSDWSEVTTATQPAGGPNPAAMAYDPARRTIVYFSHTPDGQPETWTLDGASWTQSPTGSGTTSAQFVMARDDATSNVVLFGSNGDTWTWDGGRWTPANPAHSPGPRKGMAMAYDPVHHVVVLFGGDSGQGAALQHHNDLWSWSGNDWSLISGS